MIKYFSLKKTQWIKINKKNSLLNKTNQVTWIIIFYEQSFKNKYLINESDLVGYMKWNK